MTINTMINGANGAIELTESELEHIAGGPAFMKLGDIKGEVVQSGRFGAGPVAYNLGDTATHEVGH